MRFHFDPERSSTLQRPMADRRTIGKHAVGTGRTAALRKTVPAASAIGTSERSCNGTGRPVTGCLRNDRSVASVKGRVRCLASTELGAVNRAHNGDAGRATLSPHNAILTGRSYRHAVGQVAQQPFHSVNKGTNDVNISVILILLTLASTAISTFWSKLQWAKACLFALAVITSGAAILHATKTDEEFRSVLKILESLAISIAPPPEFEETLRNTAREVVNTRVRHLYPELTDEPHEGIDATIRKSDNVGFVIGIFMPDTDGHRTGYPDAYLYISAETVRSAVKEFAKGRGFHKVLEDGLFWRWDGDVNDDRLLQSTRKIARLAFSVARQDTRDDKVEFLSHFPNHKTIRLKPEEDGSQRVEILAEDPESVRDKHLHLLTLDEQFFRSISNVGAIERGRKTFNYIVDSLQEKWTKPGFRPVVYGR